MKLELVRKEAPAQARGVILFVPGACHGAWCFEEHYLAWFSERGWTSYAMSYRGHGTSEGREAIDSYGLDDYVLDVESIMEQVRAENEGTPFYIVAHSLGGMVVQRLIGKRPGCVDGVVFLASMPHSGTGLASQLKMMFAHFAPTKAMLDVNSGKKLTPEQAQQAVVFGGRISLEEAARYAELVQAESKRVTKEQAKPSTSNFDVKLPVRIVGSKGDWMFPDQSANAAAYHVTPVMVEGLCHDMMLDRDWERGAEAVLSCLEDIAKA